MTARMDHAAGRLHVGGARREPSDFELGQRTDTLRWIAAETRAGELVEALKAALAGAPHWRWGAQRLLESISRGEMKEPR